MIKAKGLLFSVCYWAAGVALGRLMIGYSNSFERIT